MGRFQVDGSTGERIRHWRRRSGLSQAALTEGLPVAASYISLIELGRRVPTERVLAVIAERLGCTANYLITGQGGPGADELWAELRAAWSVLWAGDPASAAERFEEIARAAAELRCEDVMQDARWGLARSAKASGALDRTAELLETLSREPELKGSLSRTMLAVVLAHTYLESGLWARGIEVAEAALAAPGEGGAAQFDELMELACTLVGCYHFRGDDRHAARLMRRILAEAELSGSPRALAAACWQAGVLAESRGAYAEALEYSKRAGALYDQMGEPRQAATMRLNAAWAMLRLPEPDTAGASDLLTGCIDVLARLATVVEVACAEEELARCLLLQGEPAGAIVTARRAIDRLGTAPRRELSGLQALLGSAYLAAGDVDSAVASYTVAATMLADTGASRRAAAVWRELGDALLAAGLRPEATEAYRRAADTAGVSGPAWAPAFVPAGAAG